jgi:hypothetical protein
MAFTACGGSKEEAQSPEQQPGAYPSAQPGYPQQQPYPQQPQGQYQQAPTPGQYPQQQQPAPGYPQQQPYPQQPAAQPGAQPSAQPAPGQAAPGQIAIPGFSMPGMAAPPSGQAQAIDASVAAPAQALITTLASSEAPAGAKPLGSLVAGNFSAGSSLESQIQLQPGKCYTVVGAGLPGVNELNLQFIAISPLPAMSPVLAEDKSTGPQAVLGQKPNCYKTIVAWPVPVKLVVTVASGSGIAGAQVFEK